MRFACRAASWIRVRALGHSVQLVAASVAMILALSTAVVSAEHTEAGSTSRQSRQDAVSRIPFNRLNDMARQKISYVVSNPSIFRRLPSKTIECDPEMYIFLVRYPEVVANIWQLMEVTSVTMERHGPYNYKASDGLGTVSDVELIYGDSNTHILYADGQYDGNGPLVRKPIKGRCVMLLRSEYARTPENKVRVVSQLDVFVRIESTGIDLLARTLHPLLGRTADINFVESTKFLGRLSRAAEDNGPGVQELAGKLDKVRPEVRAKFSEIAANVHSRAVARVMEDTVEISARPDQEKDDSVRVAATETETEAKPLPIQADDTMPR